VLYSSLVQARRAHALFQHHDAITGTAKQAVMHDYALKMWEGLKGSRRVQKAAMQAILEEEATNKPSMLILRNDHERPAYQTQPNAAPLDLEASAESFIVVFNPLAEETIKAVSFHADLGKNGLDLSREGICVEGPDGNMMDYQVNPTWNSSGQFILDVSFVEIVFSVRMQPLAIVKFYVKRCSSDRAGKTEKTRVFCRRCPSSSPPSSPFELSPRPPGQSVVLTNEHLALTFDSTTDLLVSVEDKGAKEEFDVGVEFAAYPTSQFRSGAYLFKPDLR